MSAFDPIPPLSFACPKCCHHTPIPQVDGKYVTSGVKCEACGFDLDEWRRVLAERAQIDREIAAKHNFKSEPKTRWVPSKRDRERCLNMLRKMVEGKYTFITSYFDFDGAEDSKIIPKGLTHGAKMRMVQVGVREGWLVADWRGVGLTPWAGAPRRARDYQLTEKGRKAVEETKVE